MPIKSARDNPKMVGGDGLIQIRHRHMNMAQCSYAVIMMIRHLVKELGKVNDQFCCGSEIIVPGMRQFICLRKGNIVFLALPVRRIT